MYLTAIERYLGEGNRAEQLDTLVEEEWDYRPYDPDLAPLPEWVLAVGVASTRPWRPDQLMEIIVKRGWNPTTHPFFLVYTSKMYTYILVGRDEPTVLRQLRAALGDKDSRRGPQDLTEEGVLARLRRTLG